MTVLISGGDSFTAGDELPSPEHAWPALLARRAGYTHCATAVGGSSNSAIRRRVMNAVHSIDHNDVHVAVMWSFPNRYEFRFTYDTGNENLPWDSPWYSINPWTYNIKDQSLKSVAQKHRLSKFAKTYVEHVADSEYWEVYTSWCEILMLQNYLTNKNISYSFMCVDNSLFECHSDNMDVSLHTLLDNINTFAHNEGMYNWAKRTKQPFYSFHPQESAHIEWINTVYDRIT